MLDNIDINNNKIYLGDSVYADFDGYMIQLTTENGISTSNTIFLEASVLIALIDYAKKFNIIK